MPTRRWMGPTITRSSCSRRRRSARTRRWTSRGAGPALTGAARRPSFPGPRTPCPTCVAILPPYCCAGERRPGRQAGLLSVMLSRWMKKGFWHSSISNRDYRQARECPACWRVLLRIPVSVSAWCTHLGAEDDRIASSLFLRSLVLFARRECFRGCHMPNPGLAYDTVSVAYEI